MYISDYRRRAKAVYLCFFVFFLLCISRLLFIQFFRSEYLTRIAKKQHNLFIELEPKRGTIFDRNLKPLAINLAVDSLYADPHSLSEEKKEEIVRQLTPVLQVSPDYLKERLSRKKYFIWLARKITPEQSQKIEELNLEGLGFIKETKRSYHNGYLAAHIIGFAGLDNVGLDGIELYYDDYLRGEMGWAKLLRDARQKKLDLQERMVLPKDGYDIVLTIDEVIQFIAERELEQAFKSYKALGASIVVMNPHTGEILALANRPNFDLNFYPQAAPQTRRNRAVTDLFEPGSVFKIVTAAAVLEEGKVSEEDKFFCEEGEYRYFSHTLHDHRPHGEMTFKEIIGQSSNIGTAKVAQVLGPDLLYRYIKLFGFGSKLGIDLYGEINGIARPPRGWSKISIVTIPMGQEVGVTALQLCSAISAVANGGQLMKPYMVRQIRDKHEELIKDFAPKMIKKVISLDTAERLKDILVNAVDNGTGTRAKINGVSVAGKTGTAQKIEPDGRYSHKNFIASFIGFAPADDPQIAIVVMVDQPQPQYFGGTVAAPVFKNVADETLRYLKMKQYSEEEDGLNSYAVQ